MTTDTRPSLDDLLRQSAELAERGRIVNAEALRQANYLQALYRQSDMICRHIQKLVDAGRIYIPGVLWSEITKRK